MFLSIRYIEKIISPFNNKNVNNYILFRKIVLKVMFDKIKLYIKIIYNLVIIQSCNYIIITKVNVLDLGESKKKLAKPDLNIIIYYNYEKQKYYINKYLNFHKTSYGFSNLYINKKSL